MKRIVRAAGLALFGLSLVGIATYVFAQTPGAGQPAPQQPVVVPSNPAPAAPGLQPQLQPPAPVTPGSPDLPVPVVPGTPEPPRPVTAPDSTKAPVPMSPLPIDLEKPGTTMPKPALTLPGATPDKAVVIPGAQDGGAQPQAQGQKFAPDDAAPGDSDSLTGRQEPAVSLEWIGPNAAKVGQPADYSILVRNVCNIAVQQVLVRVRIPQGITVAGTEPKAVSEDNVLMWEVGTMLPKQERNLQMKLMSTQKGDVGCQAWVTFTGASVMRIKVREPKLLIKATAPDKAMVGDSMNFALTVSNPGDYSAELVKIHAELSEGLEHARGNKLDFDLGNLSAGETRTVQVLCVSKAGGMQTCECFAEADGGLKAADKAGINVIMPKIDLEVTGPKLRYLDRKAVYKFTVKNPGDAPATNVVISDVIPQGFKFLQANEGGRHDFSSHTVAWFLGEIGPGQSREVLLEVLAVNPGEHHHKATVAAARGLKQDYDCMTKVVGLSAILMEMVDLEDPVEVGADTTYEIRITNTGSMTETDIRLVCTVPDKMQFKSASGPAQFQQNGNEIIFEAIPKLAPRADAIFRVTCKAVTPGVVNFKSRVTSTLLVDPVHKEEATRIYAD
jgi:uncharacterized repeat protein (TIGR01451 family)